MRMDHLLSKEHLAPVSSGWRRPEPYPGRSSRGGLLVGGALVIRPEASCLIWSSTSAVGARERCRGGRNGGEGGCAGRARCWVLRERPPSGGVFSSLRAGGPRLVTGGGAGAARILRTAQWTRASHQ